MTTASIPSTQLAVLSSKDSITLHTIPVAQPDAGEVLIKNVAVASNPKDWKVPKNAGPDYNFVEGNDVAGTIAAVGQGVEEFKVGDRVAAFTKMGTKLNKYGAYQQYTVAPASITFPVHSTTSFEEASTLPLAFMTAAIGLFVRLGLPEPPADGQPALEVIESTTGKQIAVVIYGASSSVGAYAVQLVKRAGLFAVAIAGSSSDYVSSLGADVVIDYREHKTTADLESAILAALDGRPSSAAYDAICAPGTILALARVVSKASPNGKGKVTFVLPLSEEDQKQFPPGVEGERTAVSSAYGADEAFASRFYRQLSVYLVASEANRTPFQPNRVRVLPNGLESVPQGIAQLLNNEVHAEKLVYRIADTPSLKA